MINNYSLSVLQSKIILMSDRLNKSLIGLLSFYLRTFWL